MLKVMYQHWFDVDTIQHLADFDMEFMSCRCHPEVVLLDFSLSVKAAPHECVKRTGQPYT